MFTRRTVNLGVNKERHTLSLSVRLPVGELSVSLLWQVYRAAASLVPLSPLEWFSWSL